MEYLAGERNQAVQGMGHQSQVMVHRDRRDLCKSQDLVTVDLKGHLLRNQVIMPPPHKDRVIMVPPLLKDQVTMDNKNLITEAVDQLLVLVPLNPTDPTTTMDHPNQPLSLNNNLALPVCLRCFLPLI